LRWHGFGYSLKSSPSAKQDRIWRVKILLLLEFTRRERRSTEGIECLREANFRTEDISILFRENVGNKDFAHVAPTTATGALMGGVG
jgi:hypothetical protein